MTSTANRTIRTSVASCSFQFTSTMGFQHPPAQPPLFPGHAGYPNIGASQYLPISHQGLAPSHYWRSLPTNGNEMFTCVMPNQLFVPMRHDEGAATLYNQHYREFHGQQEPALLNNSGRQVATANATDTEGSRYVDAYEGYPIHASGLHPGEDQYQG